MISLRDVDLVRDGRTVLSGLTLEIPEQRVGIIGANGSGKSSFARLLNGLLVPTTGRVTVDGLSTADDARAVRGKVGFVFQNPDNQIVMPTVAEDLGFGLKNMKLTDAEIESRVGAGLAQVGLEDFENRLVHRLSGGEKQLLAIAGVVVMNPDVIVFDEPTTLLDLGNARRIMTLIAGLRHRVVLVTHDLDQLAGFDRVICLHEGRVFADGLPSEVCERYRDLFA